MAAPASGDKGGETTCIGGFTGVAPRNLVVPTGKFCSIVGAKVGGNVLVEKGAVGFHSDGSTIRGSVLSPGPIVLNIQVLDSKVGHDIVVANTRAGQGSFICHSTVGGNLVFKNNAGATTVVRTFLCGQTRPHFFAGNTIGGNIIADKNSGPLTINHNSVGKSVHIDKNTGGGVIGPGKCDRTYARVRRERSSASECGKHRA